MTDEATKALRAAMAKAFGDRHLESAAIPAYLNATRPKRKAAREPIDRLIGKVVFGSADCWYFAGSLNRLGYGTLPAMGESKAHRVSWRIFRGDIPPGMHVLHRCDVRNCVNPDHLFIGTHAENMRDMSAKGRGHRPDVNGEKNPMARLTGAAVAAIRSRLDEGARQIDMAREYGVSPMTISRIARNESWNH